MNRKSLAAITPMRSPYDRGVQLATWPQTPERCQFRPSESGPSSLIQRNTTSGLSGAKEVRSSEGDWPAKGARFHHTVGIWPLHIRDQTSVMESDRPTSFVLQAKVRPFGFARIDLELSP